MLILHGSDLQTGRPYRPHAAEAFLSLGRDLAPDLVVLSGDLTQRAKAREYQTVRDFVAKVQAPLVITPGNHDVPLYRIWERLVSPYGKWRRFMSEELDSVTRLAGATVVALNSSAPRRAIVGGRLDARQVAFARRALTASAGSDVRILVTHHHFVVTPDGGGGHPLPRAGELLRAFESMGVDLILGGHVHRTHLSTSRALVPDPEGRPGIPLLACGTTASSRGRPPEEGANGLHVIRVDDRGVEVTPYRFDERSRHFDPGEPVGFPRWRLGAETAEDHR
ncbi:MAG: metallophosphoesterase [Gemmatimonadetes bacterium]|nr:metallophosphoesterase [Gemmatimonadota bacterium]